jgi:hypothetical protein
LFRGNVGIIDLRGGKRVYDPEERALFSRDLGYTGNRGPVRKEIMPRKLPLTDKEKAAASLMLDPEEITRDEVTGRKRITKKMGH